MERIVFRDKNKCMGCYACVVACKAEHGFGPHPTDPPVADPEGPELIRLYRIGPEMRGDEVYQYFVPVACMHCVDAPCIAACPRSAIYKDSQTTTTLVDESRCIGCKFCLWVCPCGAPQFYRGKMKVCDQCLGRFEEGRKDTACEAVCQAGAICVGSPGDISNGTGREAAGRAGFETPATSEGPRVRESGTADGTV